MILAAKATCSWPFLTDAHCSVEVIIKATGLSRGTIEELRKQLN